jgi:N-acylglucosamine 2-epimerase/mannose-6-phosphate isomerase
MRLETVARLERWLFDESLPFWFERAWDAQFGGFVEEMTLDGRDAAVPERRLRVAPRQIYVMAHAAMLGARGGEPLIARGAEWLSTKGWMPDKGAFARRITREGEIADATIDLYDHAFALFGFAWAFEATGDAAYREWAGKTLDAIETHLAALGGGFLSSPGAVDQRDQNPHMHLFEAALAAFDATGDDRYQALARSIGTLALEKFVQPDSATLIEHFDPQWWPLSDSRGRRVEPGHQFEWAWLLHQAEPILGVDSSAVIAGLAGAAEAHGVNSATRLTYNVIDIDGAPIDSSSRSWPTTERLKAGVALMERGDPRGAIIAEDAAIALLSRHLKPEGVKLARGLWMEQLDREGRALSQSAPASILYHLFLAIAETMRWRAQSA